MSCKYRECNKVPLLITITGFVGVLLVTLLVDEKAQPYGIAGAAWVGLTMVMAIIDYVLYHIKVINEEK